MNAIANTGWKHLLKCTDPGRSILGENIIDVFWIHVFLGKCTIFIAKAFGIVREKFGKKLWLNLVVDRVVSIAINKRPFGLWVRMNIKESNQILAMIMQQGVDCEYRGLFMSNTIVIKSVQVVPQHVHPVCAMEYPIWVDHGNYKQHECFSQKLCLRTLAQ